MRPWLWLTFLLALAFPVAAGSAPAVSGAAGSASAVLVSTNSASAVPGGWSHGSVAPAGTVFALGSRPIAGLAFYRLSDFEGAALVLLEDEPDIARFGLGNRARSVRVSGRWLLCSEPGFRGRCVEVRASESRLAWGKRLTSIGSARYLGRSGEALEMR
jgi:hypothetical protein